MPKKMPTLAEKPRPIAKDHRQRDREAGEQTDGYPMPAPQECRDPADRRQHRGLGQELEQDLLAPGAKRCGRRSRASAR